MLKTLDLFFPNHYSAVYNGIADLSLEQKLLYGIEFHNKACHDDDFLLLRHRGIKDVRESVQFIVAHNVHNAVITGQMAARNLRQPHNARENIRRRDLRLCKFRITFCFDCAVNLCCRCGQLNCTDFLGDCRKIETFLFRHTICN